MTDIRVPTLGESVTEATIGKWFKKPGDPVAVDEPLVELETDKVTIEVPAPAAGVLAEILVGDGATVLAEQLIARIDTEGKVAASGKPAAAAAPARAAAPVAASVPTGGAMAGVAMPAAAKLMADKQLAAGSVAGSGRDGRVTKGDVLSAVASGATKASPRGA